MKSSMIIHPDELSKVWIDKLADAGVSTLGIHPAGGRFAHENLEKLIEQMKTPSYRELIDYAHQRGLEVEYEIHAAGYLMPRDLFAEHPEYFRENKNGIRTNDMNFCVSNDEAMDIFAERAAELAASLYGSSDHFYFWLDDGHDIHCHCPQCRGLSPSDQQLLALDKALERIRKKRPDAKLAYLAYMDTLVPPVSTRVGDGIFLEYAPIKKYTAKGENAVQQIKQEKEMMAALMKCFENSTKKVLEYWYDNSLFSHWKKPPVEFVLDERGMRADISEYISAGFDSISTFACFLDDDYSELYGDVDIRPFAECVK